MKKIFGIIPYLGPAIGVGMILGSFFPQLPTISNNYKQYFALNSGIEQLNNDLLNLENNPYFNVRHNVQTVYTLREEIKSREDKIEKMPKFKKYGSELEIIEERAFERAFFGTGLILVHLLGLGFSSFQRRSKKCGREWFNKKIEDLYLQLMNERKEKI
jgi:coproporphyrinogen III oxidase